MEKRTSRAERFNDMYKTFPVFRNVTRSRPEDEGSNFFLLKTLVTSLSKSAVSQLKACLLVFGATAQHPGGGGV
jgi:hypothetical protein